MIPFQVALVPYGYRVKTSTLLRVAAALQTQLTRDFIPIWGIPAVVSAFESLDDLPPACIPLAIVEPNSLHPRYSGFHRTEAGDPIGIIAGGKEWSLAASHELLEIVCDPSGTRKVIGESIADSASAEELTGDAGPHPVAQGQVAYLLEICDPCQDREFAYTVDGILVSDFVTPRYYASRETERGRYSFTGKVTQPLQILRGGYISWYTYSSPGAPTWQANMDEHDRLRIGPLGVPAPSFSRDRVDHFTELVNGPSPAKTKSKNAVKDGEPVRKPARSYGEALRQELDRLLAAYGAERAHGPVPLAELLPILERLATKPSYWKRFEKDPNALFEEEEIRALLPRGSHYERYPTRAEFKATYDWVKNRVEAGDAYEVRGMVATTAMKGAIV